MLKKYEELVNVDVSPFTEKRDGLDYLNWAKVVDLLHENGASVVYFEPVVNPNTGSSLFMSEQSFTDKNGIVNRVYETAVKIVIDDLEFIQRGPVMNASNPVKDNSMSQQRLWNCQTRLFVKGVAIRTGLGFKLWIKEEENDAKNNWEDDLSKHNIFKIQDRIQQLVTRKMKEGLSVADIAKALNITEQEFNGYFAYFNTIDRLEKAIGKVQKND